MGCFCCDARELVMREAEYVGENKRVGKCDQIIRLTCQKANYEMLPAIFRPAIKVLTPLANYPWAKWQ